ncbi:MAG: hypothetical protein AABZ12_09940, partial [Planctomycetota bacterium]
MIADARPDICIVPQGDTDSPPGPFPSRLMLPAAALVLLAVLINVGFPAYLACCSRERVVRYVADDAYYYFSVAQRLAHGEWATADGVTKTTGFHPLY